MVESLNLATSQLSDAQRELDQLKKTAVQREAELKNIDAKNRLLSDEVSGLRADKRELSTTKEENLKHKAELLKVTKENWSLQESKRERDQLAVSHGIQKAKVRDVSSSNLSGFLEKGQYEGFWPINKTIRCKNGLHRG